MNPTAPQPHVVSVPIERAATQRHMSQEAAMLHNDGALFALQRQIANAKFELLRFLISQGYTPVKDTEVEVTIRVTTEAVPDSVTDGRPFRVEPMAREFVYLKWAE